MRIAFEPAATPWGDPDLQGIWSPGYTILTPLERADEVFSGRPGVPSPTRSVAALEERASVAAGGTCGPSRGRSRTSRAPTTRRSPAAARKSSGPAARRSSSTRPTARFRSRPHGQAVADAAREKMRSELADGPEDRRDLDRCRGVSLPFISGTSGTFSRIVQTPGSVTLYHEDGPHRRRVPHRRPSTAGRTSRSTSGSGSADSVGRWEGDTLVVDTTNFTGLTSFKRLGRAVAPGRAVHPRRGRPDHVRGHGRRPAGLDPTLDHRVARCSGSTTGENQIFEAACHEGNYAMTSIILAGARVLGAAGDG